MFGVARTTVSVGPPFQAMSTGICGCAVPAASELGEPLVRPLVATQDRLDGQDLIVEQGPELGKRDRHSHTVGRQPTCAPPICLAASALMPHCVNVSPRIYRRVTGLGLLGLIAFATSLRSLFSW